MSSIKEQSECSRVVCVVSKELYGSTIATYFQVRGFSITAKGRATKLGSSFISPQSL
ncbi:unnamed protein product [Haemonchus placei]|uniref:Uncharacterized protein n=1 Tax=Haemonchus placei TaxID=6290 RepID=A0A3P8CB82_HAEPC|nr:unnamed protein product [Haemonchus placei]